MLLQHDYEWPELNLTLELFLRVVEPLFADRLLSVILQGSAVFDDLCPGYSDLDFVAIVADDDLAEGTVAALRQARVPLRSGRYGKLAWALEGPFLPRRLLDPQVTGRAFNWGTSGEREWNRNQLGPLVHRVIRDCGHVIYGADLRAHFPPPERAAMLAEVRHFCLSALEHATPGTLKSVDWLLTAARLLLWLKEDSLSSKSDAADWALTYARGQWRTLLPQAKDLRILPGTAGRPETQEWLDRLGEPIRQAAEELLREVDRSS